MSTGTSSQVSSALFHPEPRVMATGSSPCTLFLARKIHYATASCQGSQAEKRKVGIPGITPIKPSTPAATASDFGVFSNWETICPPMSWVEATRVTIIVGRGRQQQ